MLAEKLVRVLGVVFTCSARMRACASRCMGIRACVHSLRVVKPSAEPRPFGWKGLDAVSDPAGERMDPAWVALRGGRASGFCDPRGESSLSGRRPVSCTSHSQIVDAHAHT